MNGLKVIVKTETSVKIGDKDAYEILDAACDLAHHVCEELSVYRQRHDLDPLTFDVEGEACQFLDLIGD